MKIQEATSNVVITEKNEKQYVRQVIQLGIGGTQGALSDKVTTDIDGFTDEPVVQCDVRVVKITFLGDSKQMIQLINRYK